MSQILDCAASSCALPTKVSDLANELSSVEVVAPSAPSKPQSKTTLEKLGSATVTLMLKEARSAVACLLDGIDWRNPRWTQRPAKAG